MKKILFALICVVLAIATQAQTPDANGIVYVKLNGSGNGSSWANATNNLQGAINAVGVSQVWVAKGIYQLAANTSYVMKNGVAIYGSFPDNGTPTITDRNFTNYVTTLKGNGKSVINNNFTNSQPLLTNAILDGFLITGGAGSSGGGGGGGGIYNNYASPTLTNLIINSSTATDGVGGGIYNNNNSSPVLTNVLISGNTAFYGGGIFNYVSSSPILTNVTISGNSADYGGGICNIGGSKPKVRNSIILGNNTGVYNANDDDDVPVYTNSLVQNLTATTNGNLNATGITAAQVFNAPQNPGLSTAGNYTLNDWSIAINKGNQSLFANLDATTKDLAGNLRLQKGQIDLGAYENANLPLSPDANGIIYVKTVATGNFSGDSWANATDNLRVAIYTTGVTKVWVSKGIYQLPANTSYVMKNGVGIYGGFPDTGTPVMTDRNFTAHVTTLKGNAASVINNNFTYTQPLLASAILDGFTLTGGAGSMGGGMYNNYASPTLSNVKISENTAGIGGAILNSYSSPILTNVTINGNVATNSGGGIYNSSSSPTLTNVAITGNQSLSFGSGLLNSASSPILTNVTISGNIGGTGGAVYNSNSSKPQLRNSIVLGNNTGVYNNTPLNNNTPVYTNSLIQDLSATTDGNIDATGIIATSVFTAPETPGISTTGDYTLKLGSVAINTGDKTLFDAGKTPALSAITTDLAGNTRVFGTNIDLGAYESQRQDQTITFGALDIKTISDLDFNPGATTNSSLPITYESSNTSVATIVDGKIHIVGVGSTIITARQGGDANYNAAADVQQTLTVEAVLPVSFISFDAKLNKNGSVNLTWITASETVNSHFIVLKSTDGVNFTQLAKISGSGNGNQHNRYQTGDKNPANGNNYYQLLQYDTDGKVTVLAIKIVNVSLSITSEISVYPNPAQEVVNIKFEKGTFQNIKLIDLNGRVLINKSIEAVQTQSSLNITELPASTYVIFLEGNTGTASKTVIKN